MLGRRDDMPSVYASLEIMVSASRQEGLPIAILEGMASSRPLIATSVGAVPTVVLDGRTGVLLPPENIEALASEIVKLLKDSSRRESLGACRDESSSKKKFSAERMTADYLCVYEEAVATADKKTARHFKSPAPSKGKTK